MSPRLFAVFTALLLLLPGAAAAVDIGVDAATCAAPSLDDDGDGLDDSCENLLAYGFAPELHFYEDAYSVARETFWAARPEEDGVLLFYALGYLDDYGAPFPFIDRMTDHMGDSEFLVLRVHNESAGEWLLDWVEFSSHHHVLAGPWNWADHWEHHDYGELAYVNSDYRGRPEVHVARWKHANYPTLIDCIFTPLWPTYLGDTCGAPGPVEDVDVLPGRNLGSGLVQLIDWVSNPAGGPEVDYFWTDVAFCGWQVDTGPRTDCVGAENSYSRALDEFGFFTGPSIHPEWPSGGREPQVFVTPDPIVLDGPCAWEGGTDLPPDTDVTLVFADPTAGVESRENIVATDAEGDFDWSFGLNCAEPAAQDRANAYLDRVDPYRVGFSGRPSQYWVEYWDDGLQATAPLDYTIDFGGACSPSCTGMSCGSDGCGGSCGSCGGAENCLSGACAPAGAPGLTRCGTISGSETWTLAQSPVLITCDVRIDGTVTIEPGVVVAVDDDKDIGIYTGSLIAVGTPAEPIVFTSSTGTAPGSWGGLVIRDGAGPIELDQVEFRYGGSTYYQAVDFPIRLDPTFVPQLGAVTLQDNRIDAIELRSGTWTTGMHLLNNGHVYWIDGDMTVDPGATLTIDPGVIIKFDDDVNDLRVHGTLIADAAGDAPIVFTSYRDDLRGGDTNNDGATTPGQGDWGGIHLNYASASADSLLNNVVVTYGSSTTYGSLGDAIRLDGRANPTINNLQMHDNDVNGLQLETGTYNTNLTWDITDIPYWIKSDITIDPGATLTVAPGVVLKFEGNTDDLLVHGTLDAQGTTTAPIVLTSGRDDAWGGDTNDDGATLPGSSDWGGLHLNYSSASTPSTLDHVRITYGGSTAYGALDYPVVVDGKTQPDITNTVITNNRRNGLTLETGTYTSNLRLNVVGIPYRLENDLTVDSGVTMTVDPGVVVKAVDDTTDINVNGTLIAIGTPQAPIVFTSDWDDAYGGDTNADGATLPGPSDWGGIHLNYSSAQGTSQLEHVLIANGGSTTYGALGYPVAVDGKTQPSIISSSLAQNRIDGIRLETGTYSQNLRLNVVGLAYWVPNDVTVPPGVTMTVDPGVIIKMQDDEDDFEIDGTLVAAGTAAAPIVFTSGADDAHGGDTNANGPSTASSRAWGGIHLDWSSSQSSSVLDHVQILYGGSTDYSATDYPISLDLKASPTITNTTIEDSRINGIGVDTGTYSSATSMSVVGLPYWINSDVTVGAGTTLTIDPGVVVKFQGDSDDLVVQGSLDAQGTAAEPIVFTAGADDTIGGDTNDNGPSTASVGAWGGIALTSSGNLLEHAEIRFGGSEDYSAWSCGLYVSGGAVSVAEVQFSGVNDAICVTGSSPVVDLGGGSFGSTGGNTFTDSTGPGDWAVYNGSPVTVHARYNYWASADPAVIGGLIWDQLDDTSLGLVVFTDYQECLPHEVQACGTDVGECVSGSQTCLDTGYWGACVGEIPAIAELCDGLDNDCDGSVPADEADSDADGSRVCEGDCDDADSGRYPGAPEACNGLDDDCDTALPADELDTDGDGFRGCEGDCDDAVATRYPLAPELCNGLDDDCDTAVPATEADGDADGFRVCEGDCDDAAASRHPGAPELCNAIDDDCDTVVPAVELDADGDGQSSCEGDCDDATPARWVGAPEICDGIDNDCDGLTPPEEVDTDLDGQRVCAGDCDDGDATVFLGGPELCDGWDNDCDSALGPAELDADGDSVFTCAYVLTGGNPLFAGDDCDDADPASFPGAPEICDGLDNDCDSTITDEGADDDGDGVNTCTDCDDGDPNVYPAAPEICDGADDDCDLAVPEDEQDPDADGYIACLLDAAANPPPAVQGGEDCDPADSDVWPGAPELCDGLDDDCDGALPADEADADSDGWMQCAGDCDDASSVTWPAAPEACDGLDNDCNSAVPVDEADDDADGWRICEGDCLDSDASVRPGAAEACNGVDDDCDAVVPAD